MAESASGKCFLFFPKAMTRGFPCSLYPLSSCRALWADSVSAKRGGHRVILWMFPSDGHSACSGMLNEHCTHHFCPGKSPSIPGKAAWHNRKIKE